MLPARFINRIDDWTDARSRESVLSGSAPSRFGLGKPLRAADPSAPSLDVSVSKSAQKEQNQKQIKNR
jgi:hypothetical protein